MNRQEFEALCVPPVCSLRDALQRLDATARGVLLVQGHDGALLRTVTDGDLRRARLQHMGDGTLVASLPAQTPITVNEAAGAASILAVMDKYQIDHVPVLDASGCAVDVVFRRELSQRIWLSSPHLGEEEVAFVDEAFKTNWIAPLGPNVDGFERELAAHVGVGHAAALSSGTAALHLGLVLLGVQSGDVVFCSSLTFVASCNPILYCGATPVFIDAEPETWNMSPVALERAFEAARRGGRLPRCVILVNLYGQSADMDALLPICARYGVPVLEDAAESLGGSYKGRSSGTFGRMGVYSFNGNKIITTSGGGMLVADDADLVARARELSTQARDPAPHHQHSEMGFNYRMRNVLAGIGRGQLRVLDQRVAQRRCVFERYRQVLTDRPDIQRMTKPPGFQSTRWLTCLPLSRPTARQRCAAVIQRLERHSIEARPVCDPMHLQPLFFGAPYFNDALGEDGLGGLFQHGLCLPSGFNTSEDQQDRVIMHLRRALVQSESLHATT